MTEPGAARVAVYLDFDNIVLSRYDQVHGRNSFQRDKPKGLDAARQRASSDRSFWTTTLTSLLAIGATAVGGPAAGAGVSSV